MGIFTRLQIVSQYFSLFSDTELQGQTLYIMLQMSFVVVCYILRSGYKSKIMHSDNDIFIISDVIPTIFLLSVLYFDIFEFISLLKYPFMIALILDYYLYHYYRKAFSYDIHEDSIIKKLHVMQILLCSSYLVYIEQVLQYEF